MLSTKKLHTLSVNLNCLTVIFELFAVLRSCSLFVHVAPLWHSMVDSASAEKVGGKFWVMLCEAFTETTLNFSL